MKIINRRDLGIIGAKGLQSLYPQKLKFTVGMATCGQATGAQEVYDELIHAVREFKLDAIIAKTGCLGFCQKEPLVDVYIPGAFRLTYCEMTPEKAREIVRGLKKNKFKKEYLLCKFEEEFLLDESIKTYETNGNLGDIPSYEEVPFFAKQRKIALRNCGFIDPDSIEEYIARSGYSALYHVLTELSSGKTIEDIKKSGLRGRGGAGFPTGKKWEFCREAKGDIKYIICNADEGDPGAYMDRSVLEGDPHSVLEGMLIGAYAIAASRGFVYVRTEYPLAIVRLRQAIRQAREYGLLGKDIFGTGFDFDIEIREGSGAFVCGEETSLLHSIEGVSPEPRQKPPFPAQSGLWDKPTNINNVETWANIPPIMVKGSDWYSKIGTEKSKGTKVFSLVGKVKNTGLVEVPMGISLREIIYDIGGGIPDGKRLKAVQTGGPSGGCIPVSLIDLPVDYERLAEVGSIMGSGGMVVMDEDTCVVDIAKYFVSFTNDESCGKCTSCREGSGALLEVLTRITEGNGKEGDLQFLEELGEVVKDASQCGLGQTVPNPILSTLHHFRDEYEIHVKEKECPARVCKRLTAAPCQNACPVGIDVPSYIALVAWGRFKEAFDLIWEDNPFPAVCGRLCNHPCELECRRNEVDRPLAIRALKRFVADHELELIDQAKRSAEKRYEEKIAIIGSGPAGLTAARDLSRLGYKATVFEALPVAGGMLSVGIPEFLLSRKTLNAEIDMIKAYGVDIKTNTRLGKDFYLEDLKNQGYEAVFMAVGAHKDMKHGLSGEKNLMGVFNCIPFLRSVNLGDRRKPGDRVVIVGGGNTAFSAARICLRLGCREVHVVYPRSRKELPMEKSKIKEAEDEGIQIHFLSSPQKILNKDREVIGIECVHMQLGAPDTAGRRRSNPIKDSEFVIKADAIVTAIHQEPDLSFLPKNHGFEISKWNYFVVDPVTLQTNIPGLFAGGDAVSGPATIIEAIAAGKRAAQSIDSFLRGRKIDFKRPKPRKVVEEIELTEEMEGLERAELPSLALKERIQSFEEVEQNYTEEKAVLEAKRCLRCDLY